MHRARAIDSTRRSGRRHLRIMDSPPGALSANAGPHRRILAYHCQYEWVGVTGRQAKWTPAATRWGEAIGSDGLPVSGAAGQRAGRLTSSGRPHQRLRPAVPRHGRCFPPIVERHPSSRSQKQRSTVRPPLDNGKRGHDLKPDLIHQRLESLRDGFKLGDGIGLAGRADQTQPVAIKPDVRRQFLKPLRTGFRTAYDQCSIN